MICNSPPEGFGVSVQGVRRWCVRVGLTGGSAAAAAMLGAGVAHAEGGVDEINGWPVTPTSDTVELLTNNATLSDPGDALGLGTSPIAGEWLSAPATPLSSIGSNESFSTPDALGSSSTLLIQDQWLPGIELTSVQVGTHNAVVGFLVPVDGGHEVVDLVNVGFGAAPLINPDATGPVDVGGVQLASPHDGALLNDLADAVFSGDSADFGKATTLFDDLLGTDPSGAAHAAADPYTVAAAVATDALAADSGSLLSQASANLAEAYSVIAAAPPVSPDVVFNLGGAFGGALDAGVGQGIAEQAVDRLQSAEAVISAHDGALSTQVTQLFFVPLNQDWDTTSAALLHADQAYEAALVSGAGLDAADASLSTADLQALGDLVNSVPILDIADLINLF
jgi:hypothetical protein